MPPPLPLVGVEPLDHKVICGAFKPLLSPRFAGESVPVKFFTSTFEASMPPTTFYMPTKVTLQSLSEVCLVH